MEQPLVIAQHGDIWALHKPAGWRVHPGMADGVPDLVTWAAEQDGLPRGLAPAHRLDAGTSGVVLCAALPEARARISGWFAKGEVEKTYLALVYGRTHKKGTVHRALSDGRRGRALPATTRYRRARWLGGLTLVIVRPETGRKHQIRRHMASIGHPVVGDDRYGPGRRRPVPGFPGRLWLHCWQLALPDGAVMEDPLPPELEAQLELLERLEAASHADGAAAGDALSESSEE